jgi:ketosteroid isomerase-like protein
MNTFNATSADTFDSAVEAFRSQALPAFLRGDHTTNAAHFSHEDDVTLANPLGPPVRGWAAVNQVVAMAAAQVTDGSLRELEEVSRYSTDDLGYVVQIERAQAKLGGADEISPISLRVTMIFRREDEGWKVVHRHADPITGPRPVTSVAQL